MTEHFPVAGLELLEEQSDEVLFLADASAAEWARILTRATASEFSEGDTLVRAGERDRALYFLVDGRLTVVGAGVYKTIEAPSVVGEVAFLDGRPRSAALVAASDGRVARFDRPQLDALAEEDPDLARRMALELGRIVALRLRMHDRPA